MKTSNKILFIFSILFILFSFGCKSAKVDSQEGLNHNYELQKFDNLMVWEIDGVAKNGEPSKVYCVGTYHAGDESLSFYESTIDRLIETSDRFCCELSSDSWNNMAQALSDRMMSCVLTDFNHTLIDDLTEQEILTLSQYVDTSDLATLVCFEPWVLTNSLQNIVIYYSGLDASMALDSIIIQKLNEKGLDFEGLDELDTQIDLVSYGDWDSQIIMLKDTIEELGNLEASCQEMYDLYNTYISGDEESFSSLYFEGIETDIQQDSLYNAYINDLLYVRNKDWAKKIAAYLDEPGTTFIFAGCGHFVGKNSVFEYMRKNKNLK